MISWLFLAASLWGAAFTWNSLFPTLRGPRISALSFAAGWLTSELAVHHVAWQLAATVVFGLAGAFQSWPGQLGLAITTVSWGGLVVAQLRAARTSDVVEEALRAGLGADYRERIAPDLAPLLDEKIDWRRVLQPLPLRRSDVERIKDIQYSRERGIDLKLDVYRSRSQPTRCPVLFQIHGGGWMTGSKNEQALPLMLQLAARGWVCVSADYRLSPHATFPEHLVDVKKALAWIKQHVAEYGGDPDFVVVTGGSAGGHLAALVALTQNDPTFQSGFEAEDTSVQACVPVLRRLRLPRPEPGVAASRAAPGPRAQRDEGFSGGDSRPVGAGLADLPRERRRSAVLRDPRRERLPGSRRPGPGVREEAPRAVTRARGVCGAPGRAARLRAVLVGARAARQPGCRALPLPAAKPPRHGLRRGGPQRRAGRQRPALTGARPVPKIALRRYGPADLELTVRTWRESRRAAFWYVPLHQAHTLEDDTRHFREVISQKCEVWLAEAVGEIVGLLARDGDLVDQLFVATGAQRRGIGSLLLARARELSPTGLRLFTFVRNTAARAFYEKQGFTAVKFGTSPPPESEPDVEYHWIPEARSARPRSSA